MCRADTTVPTHSLANIELALKNLPGASIVAKKKMFYNIDVRRDIEPGEELLYDYGDRSKESLEAHPWLAL